MFLHGRGSNSRQIVCHVIAASCTHKYLPTEYLKRGHLPPTLSTLGGREDQVCVPALNIRGCYLAVCQSKCYDSLLVCPPNWPVTNFDRLGLQYGVRSSNTGNLCRTMSCRHSFSGMDCCEGTYTSSLACMETEQNSILYEVDYLQLADVSHVKSQVVPM